MEGWGPATYGDRIAAVYDSFYGETLDTESAVETLAELASGGPVLELAIGTGRLALPLAARGLEVHGIDASERMVAELRAKPGGEAIPVTNGNFADVPVEGSYHLVFIAFNTLFALLSQEDQVRCFVNVARHLTDEGVFVVEAFFPDLARFDRDQRTQTTWVDSGRVMIDASRHMPIEQRVDSQHVVITDEGTKLYPVSVRYAFPSELDLMARLAGLDLRARWGNWRRDPFTAESGRHVSVYAR
jgi:SAM-dependent methyltransferase